MAHMIAKTTSGKDAIAYVGDTPWHGLGQALTTDAPLDVWATESGLDFEINSTNVMYRSDVNNVYAQTVVTGKKVLYRKDNGHALGIVSDKYKVVQPIEVLEFFRDMVGTMANLETAGVLRNGAHYWALAKMDGEFSLAGDKVNQYLLLASSADGSLATQAKLTSIRVVCNNTLQLAQSNTSTSVTVRHNSKFIATDVKHQLANYNESFKAFEATAKLLASIKVTESHANALFVKLLGGDILKPSRAAKRALELYDGSGIGADLESAKGTAWGALNAITQLFDWETSRTGDARLRNTWFGAGANIKQQAVDELLALA
jgi:phage/plasmid-like protein (TIGR03299 family)